MHLKNKVAIVTGGASGLGLATAKNLVGAGAKVALLDINQQQGESVSRELGDRGMYCRVDISDDAAIAVAIEDVLKNFGAIHVCVNCAGRGGGATKTLGKGGRFPMKLFRDVVNINLIGTFSVVSQVAEKMAENEPSEAGERGVIIVTGSIAAYDGQRGQAAYSASKAGLVGMTLPIARDLAYYGIRMVTIAPGVFDTPILGGISDAVKTGLARAIPFPPRLGAPDDFANLAQHIVENVYLNGETIRLDGALRMS